MKRTPDTVSKERQKIGREIDAWLAGIRNAECALELGEVSKEETDKKLQYAQEHLLECQKRMRSLNYKGKKPFSLRKSWISKS